MYSSLYGDYLTPVFVQVLVANLLEQQRNQTPGAGQGFQGQPKAMVWPTKCDLRHGEVSKKKKENMSLGLVVLYRWSMRGNVTEMGIVKNGSLVARTEFSSFEREITNTTLSKDNCRILKCGEA